MYDMVTAANSVKWIRNDQSNSSSSALKEHLAASYEEYHSSKHTGISNKIMEYVKSI